MLKSYLTALKNLFFPARCLSCETRITNIPLCPQCLKRISFVPFSSQDNHTKPYDRKIHITYYKEPIPTLIHYFKYKSHTYLINFFSKLITQYLNNLTFNFSDYDYIVSVPMHRKKQKQRGYNQAALIAEILAKVLQLSMKNDIIIRERYSYAQTYLDYQQRLTNVCNNFIINKKLDIMGKNIIIVDDVITTGATMNECAKILKQNCCGKISAFTFSTVA